MISSVPRSVIVTATFLVWAVSSPAQDAQRSTRPRIAVFSGATATIHNSEPLVTSNQARARHGLPLRTRADGEPLRFDHLVPQKLAAPVEVFIERFSAHPLEKDAAELYGPPDGYLGANGVFRETRQSSEDTPVYRATLRPEDGLYLLPYMALQADGSAWEGNCIRPEATPEECRQPFYPDASRLFEEIDRSLGGRDGEGLGNALSRRADFDFYRALPPGGYKKGLPAEERTDVGEGDIRPETIGEDFIPYAPAHFRQWTRVQDLARVTNTVQQALDRGLYDGAIWLEGSPSVEETVYWLNLLIDTEIPIVGNAAQRPHGALSADGDRNIVDSVDYIRSGAWADANGRNNLGAVVVEDELVFASRQVQKTDARPGGYRATGEYGGVLGTIGQPGPVVVWFRPTTRHTWRSSVRLTELPATVSGVRASNGRTTRVEVTIKDGDDRLRGAAIPKMSMLKVGRYQEDVRRFEAVPEADILTRIEKNLQERPLAGFVLESLAPFAGIPPGMGKALERAAFTGMPTVRVGRGDAGGLTATDATDLAIEGSNLTATKARLLLMASMLKLGSLPPAADPERPTPEEREAVVAVIARFQEIFDTH